MVRGGGLWSHKKRVGLLSVYTLFFVAVFVVQPIVLVSTHTTKHYSIISQFVDLVPLAITFALIFYLFFLAGYYIRIRFLYVAQANRAPQLNLFGMLVVLSAISGTTLVIALNAENIFMLVVASRLNDTSFSLPIFKALLQSLNVYLIFLAFWLSGRGWHLAVVGIILTSLAAISIGDRSMLVLPILVSVYALYRGGRIGNLSLFLGIGIALVLLVVLGVAREYLLYDLFEVPSFARSMSRGLNLIAFDQFLLYLQYADAEPIRGGADFLNGFLGMVPRSLWPAKPEFITPGAWLGHAVYGRTDLGLPYTVPGVWYANFGIAGIVIGGFLSGVAVKYAERLIRSRRTIEGSVLYFYCLLGGLSSIFVVKAVFAYIIPLYLLKITTKKMYSPMNAAVTLR